MADGFSLWSCRKDMEINGLSSKLEDEQNLVAQLQRKIKELQVSAVCLFTVLRFYHSFLSKLLLSHRWYLYRRLSHTLIIFSQRQNCLCCLFLFLFVSSWISNLPRSVSKRLVPHPVCIPKVGSFIPLLKQLHVFLNIPWFTIWPDV